MKVIFQTSDYTDFLVRRSVLEQAGVPAHADGAESLVAMPELGFSEGYRIWVLDDDFDQAHSLLESNATEPSQDNVLQILSLGSIKFSKPMRWLFVAVFVVVASLMVDELMSVNSQEFQKYFGPAYTDCRPNMFC